MNLTEYINKNQDCYYLDGDKDETMGVSLQKVDTVEKIKRIDTTLLTDCHQLYITARGSTLASINGKRYELNTSNYADLLPNSHCQLLNATEDIQLYIILMNEPFLMDILKNKPPFPANYVMKRNSNPVVNINIGQMPNVTDGLEMIIRLFDDKGHIFRKEMLRCTFKMLLLDLGSAVIRTMKNTEMKDNTTRQDELVKLFIGLVHERYKEEHTANYYAEQLCVTPQYLNRVVKKNINSTITECIQKILMGNICKQLKENNHNLQQIANEFGFADQATFTKYFKRNMGCTPKEYREK